MTSSSAGVLEEYPKRFWDEVAKGKDPSIAGHPLMDRDGWRQQAVPISLHGDAVPRISAGKPGSESFDVVPTRLVVWCDLAREDVPLRSI